MSASMIRRLLVAHKCYHSPGNVAICHYPPSQNGERPGRWRRYVTPISCPPKRGDTDKRSPSIQQLQLSRPVDFPNTLPRLYRQDVPSRRQSRSHETFDLKVPDLKPTQTDGREGPMKSRGIKEYASLGCIFDRAYRPRPDSVALRHRDALFSGPAKDTETLHVPVVHPGIRRLITVLRASHRCSPEAVYFRRMSLADSYAPWPYIRDIPAVNQRLAADWPGLAIDTQPLGQWDTSINTTESRPGP